MFSISILLRAVNDFRIKLNYSEPKIYTGGVDITKWSSLTKQERKQALDKDWFIYYSYRNPKTGKLQKSAIVNHLQLKKLSIPKFKISPV